VTAVPYFLHTTTRQGQMPWRDNEVFPINSVIHRSNHD